MYQNGELMKKIALSSFITCLFLFLLFFSANPVSASTIAETGTCGKNATYTTDSDGTVIISGTEKIDDFNTRKIMTNCNIKLN